MLPRDWTNELNMSPISSGHFEIATHHLRFFMTLTIYYPQLMHKSGFKINKRELTNYCSRNTMGKIQGRMSQIKTDGIYKKLTFIR